MEERGHTRNETVGESKKDKNGVGITPQEKDIKEEHKILEIGTVIIINLHLCMSRERETCTQWVTVHNNRRIKKIHHYALLFFSPSWYFFLLRNHPQNIVLHRRYICLSISLNM